MEKIAGSHTNTHTYNYICIDGACLIGGDINDIVSLAASAAAEKTNAFCFRAFSLCTNVVVFLCVSANTCHMHRTIK